MEARDIQVNGIVQGVGFRPFVARLARSMGLSGWVSNNPDGVSIWVEHPKASPLDAFVHRLKSDAPSAAEITAMRVSIVKPHEYDGFEIRASGHAGSRDTLISPDLATCDSCLDELFDPEDRRYHYPFINCTNCGPRFTIIDDLPYDRAATSMRDFAMCPDCAREYADEQDRRYHAQPDACFACGPRLWLSDDLEHAVFDEFGALVPPAAHLTREQSDALIDEAATRLAAGQVLAIKGLGGWHLSCSAFDEQAVQALRERKHRPTKPLAIMVRDLAHARELCVVNEKEAALLEHRARPIVLLQRKPGTAITPGIAGALPELGIMLPSTPVQHLLMHCVDVPLVMTSGNRSGEPIVATDAQARDVLGKIADAFLGNNRAIVARYDDSVVRVLDDGTRQLVRRARGFAPMPLMLDGRAPGTDAPVIFAAGPEQKSTFAFLAGRRVYLSQHLGDLERLGAWRAWEEAFDRYKELFGLNPQVVACDMHPEYLASKWAREYAKAHGIPLIEIQHHHAHIASVLGENMLTEPVIGVALDGTGFGTDGTIWGGEVLLANRSEFRRFWHLPPFLLPGGAAAIKDPVRVAYALLKSYETSRVPFFAQFWRDNPQFRGPLSQLGNRELLDQMMEKGINSPICTSMGRFFDAVSVLLGVCGKPSYDGEAACLLEAAARAELAERGGDIRSWAAEAHESYFPGDPLTALSFHRNVIDVIIEQCEKARGAHGLSKVALSGGCMVNRLLAQGLKEGLRRRGFDVYTNRELPPNDGCIAYGQAIVARARLMEE